MLDLSIIIVNYNGERFLKNCLDSIYQNTAHLSFEIILVDNHSTDRSVEFVRANYPEVKIIENEANLGFSRANNQGLKIYQGRFALLLNNDTVVKDGALEQMVAFLHGRPAVGACGPRLLNPDGSIQFQGGIFSRRLWLSSSPAEVPFVVGACLMAKREVVEKIGGLDENLFFANEDLDFCRRVRQAGWKVYYLPAAQVVHFGGYTTKLFNQKLMIEGFRGGLYYCRKHYGNLIYQIYRFLLTLLLLMLIPFAWLLNRNKANAYLKILMICIKGEIIG